MAGGIGAGRGRGHSNSEGGNPMALAICFRRLMDTPRFPARMRLVVPASIRSNRDSWSCVNSFDRWYSRSFLPSCILALIANPVGVRKHDAAVAPDAAVVP